MNPKISVITLGVRDLDRAKQFYRDGLGCPIQQDHGQFVSLSLGDASSALALYSREALADDAGVDPQGSGFPGFTLSYIVEAPEAVDAAIASAVRAGAEIVKPVKAALWGGYSGSLRDPDGYLWKVASNSKPSRRKRGSDRAEAQPPAHPDESAVTIGVEDIKASKRFYESLGWATDKDYSKFVSFKLGDASSSLALYRWEALADDAGVPPQGTGFRGFTLSNVVDSPEGVDAALAEALHNGATIAKPAESQQWGGRSGYFTDPDGYLWKVASDAQ